MEVIESGNGEWSKNVRCTGTGNGGGGCGALLKINKSDLAHTTSHARDETTHYATIKCVSCGAFTDVSIEGAGLPQAVWANVIASVVRNPSKTT